MSLDEKLILKFLNSPTSLRYDKIEKLFTNDKYKIEHRKGSHKKITLKRDEEKYLIIPIHNNDCIDIYKTKLKKFYILTK